jgi:uncharacterized protein YllA (UPF0747 family)
LGYTAYLSQNKINQLYDNLEKKVLKAAKKQNDILIQQLHKVKNNLYPANHPQERILNIVPYLIKYGYPFLDTLYQAIDINGYDHQIIEL